MEFRINLATRVFVNTRQLSLCLAAAIVLLLAGLAIGSTMLVRYAGEINALSGQISDLDAKNAASGRGVVSERKLEDLAARIGFANSVIEKKGYNWLQLLDKLEQVVPVGAAVSSLAPDPKSGVLKLSGTARTFGNIRSFVENLEESNYFTEVYLVSQAETHLADKTPALHFVITCKVSKK